METEMKEQNRQATAMKMLMRERRSGSRRNKLAAKKALLLRLPPVDALALFKASISDYSRFGFGVDHGDLPISFA